ncbi:flagellar hook protein, epsilonproteobacterial variant [Campylobacter iguaniorum]|uniref:flagellar hook-basal body complex protein n=1 Tax=Campylobacter iguaniorum TaxID=1244531 RepID=UPI0007C87D4D|nr:flagellar hook-basal body complex protein [Campylobacter iguaniorum]ANE36561.1 flagellar hook protein, epsilonproteobacterial variant [Campylobacter iguaniorum]
MMRALWSGVSGLQAHQIAMDVEGDNIANVNTIGFKYSRVSFADLFSQTSKVATAPQGNLGGTNSMQIGLGTEVNAVTKIFKQGSIQTTEKNTDLSLQGDGFFIVSPDGGKTYTYTRNGDFLRDSQGNFVDQNGYIVQGWMRDENTGLIDATAPIKNIKIEPGLSTPANATTIVSIKGNLNSGDDIGEQKSPIYSLDTHAGWTDLNGNGIKEDDEVHSENDANDNEFYVDKNKQNKLYERGVDLGVLFNDSGEALGLREGQGMWVSYADAKATFTQGAINANAQMHVRINGIEIPATTVGSISDVVAKINTISDKTGVTASIINGNQIQLVNQNNLGSTDSMRNIKIEKMNGDNTALTSTNVITAYKYTYSPTQIAAAHTYNDTAARVVNTTEDLRAAMQEDARNWVNYTGENVNNDWTANIVDAGGNPPPPTGTLHANTSIQARNRNDGVEVSVNDKGQFVVRNPAGDNNFGDKEDSADATTPAGGGAANAPTNNDTFTNDYNINLAVTAFSDPNANINENIKLASTFGALAGGLSTGTGERTSAGINMATHSSTIEIFDSLGSKHELKIDFAKTGFSAENGTDWSMVIQVPEPAKINATAGEPTNVITGTIRFGPDGSLIGFNPSTLNFTANNGSAAGQNIELNFGKNANFDGLTSYDSASTTSDISQDGYTGGTLNGIKVDESGTIIGSFSNGRSFGLAQVSVAKFTNNEGLESDGGNHFLQTANSGAPVIGRAGTAGRGSVSASSLEMSNVDLSRSLTQLIIVQRGYQANSKTITTSDQMLNTLLQLKQ